jgi:hypothetical protein
LVKTYHHVVKGRVIPFCGDEYVNCFSGFASQEIVESLCLVDFGEVSVLMREKELLFPKAVLAGVSTEIIILGLYQTLIIWFV